jgi:hypothetical protein
MATQIQQNQIGFAPEIAPFARNLMGMAEGTAFTYKKDENGQVIIDPTTKLPIVSGFQQQPTYEQFARQRGFTNPERVAQFTDLQKRAFRGAENLGYDPYSTAAAQGLQGLAQRAGNYGYTPERFANPYTSQQAYNPSQFNAQQVNAPQLQNYQMQGPRDVQGQQATAAQLGAAPMAQAAQFQSPAALQAERVAAERVNAPQLQALSMQAAKDVGTQSLTQPGTVDQYMSPYMQSVVGIQQREAQRAADIARTQTNAQAVKAGAFGGSRQAIMDAEAARNLALQKGDIQAKGSQEAFANAQSQFNAEQQARLQAALANQGVQQQANVQNLSAGLQTQGLGAQTGLQAQGMNQSTGLQALLANQQAGLQTGQANQQMQYNTALQNAQMQQQAALANQSMGGQYGLQQGQFNQAAAMQNPQLAQQAMLANQNMGYNVGNTNLQALLAQQQLGSGQNMQAQLANQQYGLNAQQMAEQARQFGYGQQMNNAQNMAQYGQAANQLNAQQSQFGAGLGLQGLQAGMSGYQNLGAQGQNLYNQNMGNLNAQNQFGTQQQTQVQNVLNNQYQDYLAAQNQPYKQMGFLSDMYRGAPLSTQSSTMYTSPPSTIQNIASLGLGAAGISKLFARGGKVKSSGLGGLALNKLV